jgi:hypothetical protein
MAKLKLKLEDLKVQSFSTTPDPDEGHRGTVFAQLTDSCNGGDTCDPCGGGGSQQPTCADYFTCNDAHSCPAGCTDADTCPWTEAYDCTGGNCTFEYPC